MSPAQPTPRAPAQRPPAAAPSAGGQALQSSPARCCLLMALPAKAQLLPRLHRALPRLQAPPPPPAPPRSSAAAAPCAPPSGRWPRPSGRWCGSWRRSHGGRGCAGRQRPCQTALRGQGPWGVRGGGWRSQQSRSRDPRRWARPREARGPAGLRPADRAAGGDNPAPATVHWARSRRPQSPQRVGRAAGGPRWVGAARRPSQQPATACWADPPRAPQSPAGRCRWGGRRLAGCAGHGRRAERAHSPIHQAPVGGLESWMVAPRGDPGRMEAGCGSQAVLALRRRRAQLAPPGGGGGGQHGTPGLQGALARAPAYLIDRHDATARPGAR